jgi:signal transduction histidine kinase
MEFQPLQLDTMIKDLPLRARSFDESITVEVKLDVTNLKVQADPTRLAQVFDNLISNAAKYAPGSKVTIGLATHDDKVRISFSDNGQGIPPNHLPNIFTRFYRVPDLHRSVRGTGLGLFICRRIIHAHGGEITAESSLGVGTTFHIDLPLGDKASPDSTQLTTT